MQQNHEKFTVSHPLETHLERFLHLGVILGIFEHNMPDMPQYTKAGSDQLQQNNQNENGLNQLKECKIWILWRNIFDFT